MDEEKDDFSSVCQDIPTVFFDGLQLSLFYAPHSHQFGRLLLPSSKNSLHCALLWHTVCSPGHSPPVLEYLESLKTVSRPLIFCSSTSRCFPMLFRKRLISVELCISCTVFSFQMH